MKDAGKTILVVEDEAELLYVIAQMLRRAGYEVLEAQTSTEAALICERPEVPIDLILSDFNLPGGNGAELFHRVAIHRRDLRIVFMSGNQTACHDLAARGFTVLEKPFSFADMEFTVEKMLAAPATNETQSTPTAIFKA